MMGNGPVIGISIWQFNESNKSSLCALVKSQSLGIMEVTVQNNPLSCL